MWQEDDQQCGVGTEMERGNSGLFQSTMAQELNKSAHTNPYEWFNQANKMS